MVSVFAPRDEDLYRESVDLIELIGYRGDEALRVIDARAIRSVVGMVPDDMVSQDEWDHDHTHLHLGRKYVVEEKLSFDVRGGSRDPELNNDE